MNSLETFAKFIPTANNPIAVATVPSTSSILTDIEAKSRRLTTSLNESLYEVANEPSIGFYRIQEHVRKSIPSSIEKNNEIDNFKNKIQGHSFDLDYSYDAISRMTRADTTLDSISRLLTDSLYVARQINIRAKNQNLDQSTSSAKSLLKRKKINKTIIGLDQQTTANTPININKTPQRSQTMLISSSNENKSPESIHQDKQNESTSFDSKVDPIAEETN